MTRPTRRLADVGEFGLIDRIRRMAGPNATGSGVVLGMGDDAAVLRLRAGEQIVVSSDAFVEGVHFRWETQAAPTIGRRALAAALSDLAAMGARPLGFLLSLAAPPDLALARIDGVVRGLIRSAGEHGCPLVGGNVAAAGETSLTLTVTGAVRPERLLRRSGARAGDDLWLTGVLGRSALERLRAESGGAPIRHVPEPRLAAGRALGRMAGVGACIDLSDGLSADLRHLLEAAESRLGVPLGVQVDLERLPRPKGFEAACAALGQLPERLLLSGGEDYELLFTLRPRRGGGPSEAALGRRLGVSARRIGRLTASDTPRGSGPAGWRHF